MTDFTRQQAYLDLLTDDGTTGLWFYTHANGSLWADSAACRLMCCNIATNLAAWLLAADSADRESLQMQIEQACRLHSSLVCKVCIPRPQGRSLHLLLRASWHAEEASDRCGLAGVVQREASRISYDEQLRLERQGKRLERLESALLQSPVGLFDQDQDLRYRWISAPRIGLNTQSMIGNTASGFMSAQSAQILDSAKRAVMQSDKPATYRFDLVNRYDYRYSIDAYMAPTHGPDGAVDGVVTVSIDLAEATRHESQLLAAFDQAPIVIVLSRLSDGIFVNVNAHFEQLFGYTKEEAIGSSPLKLQLWHPPSSGRQFVELLEAEGHVRNRIAEFRHKDGHIGRALLSAERVQIQGETMLLGMVNDISALEDARHKLAFSEARYQLLTEASVDGVALVKGGVVVEANMQLVRILGVSHADVIGYPINRRMQDAITAGGAADANDIFLPRKYNYTRPDGASISLEISSRLLEQGDEVMHIATVRDVTEQVQSERSLRSLQASISHLMDSNLVGMLVADMTGTLLGANDYVLKLLNRSRDELQSGTLNLMQMTPASFMDTSMRLREEVRRTGCCASYERPIVRQDGTVVHLLMAVALLPDAKNQVLAIALDITDQKKSQGKLLELNAQLERRTLQAERAEAAKTLFLSSISHELRTPLHTILGYVRLMRKKALGEEEQQLGIVERRGVHLLRLIEDLLEFNHTSIAPENLRADFVDMDGFVSSLESMFAAQADQSGNQFQIRLAGVLPVGIVIDEGRLVQILRVLVDNACKYTSDGIVTLTLDCQSQQDAKGRCALHFTVEDTGRGIAAQDIAHIFEPLRRGANAQDKPGLGLGLAIADQWIKRMGSRFVVQSQVAVGSCFGFALEVEACFENLPRWHEPRMLQNMPRKVQVTEDVPTLPPEELAVLGQLIGMGRMGRLCTWAQNLEMNYPELQSVANHVGSLAAKAEVDALERLYRCWASQTSADTGR